MIVRRMLVPLLVAAAALADAGSARLLDRRSLGGVGQPDPIRARDVAEVQRLFLNPPDDSRIMMRWWWSARR